VSSDTAESKEGVFGSAFSLEKGTIPNDPSVSASRSTTEKRGSLGADIDDSRPSHFPAAFQHEL